MINARAMLAVLCLVACGTEPSATESSSGAGGFSSSGTGSNAGGDTTGGGGQTTDIDQGNPQGSTGSNVCDNGLVCSAGECCAGVCCTVSQMCCNGRCVMPTPTMPTCTIDFGEPMP